MTGQPSNADAPLDLLLKAQSGDEEALGRLLARYEPPFHRWARQRLPSSTTTLQRTGDAVHDTLAAALRNLGAADMQSEGALGAYMRQAIDNYVNDVYRRGRRRAARDKPRDNLTTLDASPLEAAVGAEALDRYDAALSRLHDDDRQAVILRLELGFDYGELTSALKTPTADAARTRVAVAVARLAQEMLRDT